MKTYKVIVVRHAESLANTQGIYQGQTFDTDLSDLGNKQAKLLAKKILEFNIDKIVSSPLKRTYQTALAISKLTGFKIETDNRLLEINHGIWEGKSKEWIMNNDLKLYERWFKYPHLVKFRHGGESLNDVKTRAKSFLNEYPFSSNTLVVTHDCVIRMLLTLSDTNQLKRFWEYPLENASINVFEVINNNGSRTFRPVLLNGLEHLKNLRAEISNQAL